VKEHIISRGLDTPVKFAHSRGENAVHGTEEASNMWKIGVRNCP
jgi:hypothetical protein